MQKKQMSYIQLNFKSGGNIVSLAVRQQFKGQKIPLGILTGSSA